MSSYQQTVENLIQRGILKTDRIIQAFKEVERKEFLPERLKGSADLDTALPIGEGQTISQPYTVAFMLETLQPKPGNKILEIGYGSGWQTAILSKIIGNKGEIIAYEIVDDVAEFGENNLYDYLSGEELKRITLLKEDYKKSFDKYKPFDRIIAAAAFQEHPDDLLETLSEEGKFVFPTSQNDIRLAENVNGNIREERVQGFVFVPITHSQ